MTGTHKNLESSSYMATKKASNGTSPQLNTEAQLRKELAQVNSALAETDEALDEWIAEAERLQGLVKTNIE